MKKLIIILAIVLGFGFTTPGVAGTIYWGCVDTVEGFGDIAYGKIRIVKDFGDIRCHISILAPNHLFKMILIGPEATEKEKEQYRPCYFIDKDGKKTETECN